MLEFDDIQHILLTRTPAITGRYEFLSFDTPAGGRAWLTELLDKVQSATDAQATMDSSDRWVTLAFTWNGLRALGVPEESLATFPDEFREGMAARADILGDTGTNAPEHWVGGLAGEDVHAIAILFSRTDEQCKRSIEEHDKLLARTDGVRSLSYLDLNASPPFNYAHDHFGFRDRLSQPVMKGSGEEPTPGSGAALEPGEFILGYPDEDGPVANLPEPEVLSRNGSYMAYRRLQEHVGAFRDYLRENADTPEGEELLAAKFMGRWRSGAPLVLAPDKDDPELGADPMRNNDYNYKEMDPLGYACPLGSHARRLNPRDTAHNMNRRRMIRRGATYGPALPEGAPDDGVDRGIAAFIICADLVRQFEFAQNVWINDKRIPRTRQRARPDLRNPGRHTGFHRPQTPDPQGTQGNTGLHDPAGRRVLLPAWDQLTAPPRHARQLRITMRARTYNQNHVASPPHWWPAHQHLLDLELSLGSATGSGLMENRFSTMTEVRNVLWPSYETPEYDAANFLQGIAGTLELFHRSALAFQELAEEATGHPVAVFQRIDQAGYKLPIDERILADTDTLMVFGLDHLLSEQEAAAEEIAAITEWLAGGHLPAAGTPSRCRLHRRLRTASGRVRTPRRPAGPAPATLRPVHPIADEGTRCACSQHLGVAARRCRGHQGDRTTQRHPRPRHPAAARQRHHVQLPSAPAALRTHRSRKRRATGPWETAR